jgi:hypothetical protein
MTTLLLWRLPCKKGVAVMIRQQRKDGHSAAVALAL